MTEERLRKLLEPFVAGMPEETAALAELYPRLLTYLELLLRWNAKTNLTAVREAEAVVTRHFGEGLFAAGRLASWLRAVDATLLDLGSGAGFPGVPIQLVYPGLAVCLAESQGKKASFLREVVRVLELKTEVWAGRVEDMQAARRFAVVTLRAVDHMQEAILAGAARLAHGGILAELTSEARENPATLIAVSAPMPVPGSERRVLRLWSAAE